MLLLDEPTNNLDPVSREQVLDAIARYPGAIVLVSHEFSETLTQHNRAVDRYQRRGRSSRSEARKASAGSS